MANRPATTLFDLAGGSLADGQVTEISFTTGLDASGSLVAFSGWGSGTGIPVTNPDATESAHKWDGGVAGTPGTIRYMFDPSSGFTAGQEAIFRAAMQLWSDVANVTFVEADTPADAQLRLFLFGSTTPGVTLDQGAYAGASYTAGKAGDTTIPTTLSATLSIEQVESWAQLDSFTFAGGYGPSTIVHELGHVIGLGHTGPYNGNVNALLQQLTPYDSYPWSIMSYLRSTADLRYPAVPAAQGAVYTPQVSSATPQMLDILAAQLLYGAPSSTTLTSGGQVFGFNTNITDAARPFFDFTQNVNPVVTLWDLGQDNTLDLSGFYTPSIVDLNPGRFSSVDGMTNNIGIAYGTAIDNVVGGWGNDVFTVNGHSDRVDGGGGDDTVRFASAYAAYLIGQHDGTITVGNGAVSDTLTNVETLAFSDGTIAVADLLADPRTLAWRTGNGAYDDPANWAGDAVPTSADIAVIDGPRGTTQTITGDGTAAQMLFTGLTGITGALAPTVLTIGQQGDGEAATLVIAPTGAIQVGESAAIVAGAIQALGRMIVAGTLTVGDGSGAPAVLAARNGGGVRASTLIMQGGSVTADAYSAVIVNSITAAPRAGRIRVEAGAELSGWGSVGGYNAGYLDNAGTVIATGGTLAVNVFDNIGTLAIAADGVLRIDPVLGALGGTTRFLGATGALLLQINPSGTATLETLADFVPGDVVAMTGLNEPVLQPTFDPTTGALSINVAISGENASPRTNQALTITLAETPADRVFFVLPGAGNTSVLYTAVGSLTGQDAGAGTGQARVLTWNPRLSGDWNTGGNWFDTTTAISQAPTATVGPGTLDTVNLLGPYGLGTLFDVVSGNGNAAAVNVTGAVAVSGTVTAGTLAVGAPDQATTLALIGSGRVQAGAATIGATLDLTAGTTLTAGGTIAIAQLTGTSGTVAVTGGALMQSPTLLVDTPNLRSLGIDGASRVVVGSGGADGVPGGLTVTSDGLLAGRGDFSQIRVHDDGLVRADGLLRLGIVSGSGRAQISDGATLSMIGLPGTTAAVDLRIDFSIGDGTLLLDTAAAQVTSETAFGIATGFGAGDVLAFNYFGAAAPTSLSYVSTGIAQGLLTLSNASGYRASLRLSGQYEASGFSLVDLGGPQLADVTYAPPCFTTGTRITTPHGSVAVEDLAVGDLVTTLSGETRPVVWIGHRRVTPAAHPRPDTVAPIRVMADAFGRGLPERDLLLSPDHALFLEDVLIPVKYLIDGDAIHQVSPEIAGEVTYWHVELPQHDVLLAEGLPAESYLDAGDRSRFTNAGPVAALHPDFSSRVWDAAGCAPLVVSGPRLAAARACLVRARRLRARSGAGAAGIGAVRHGRARAPRAPRERPPGA